MLQSTCDLHVSTVVCFHHLMVMQDCLILPSIQDISLTSSNFRILTSMGLKGGLSGDLDQLSELQIL